MPWWVFIYAHGLIRSKRVGDRRAAEAVASAIRRRLKAGELNIAEPVRRNRSPEFAEYAQRYLSGYAKTACKWST